MNPAFFQILFLIFWKTEETETLVYNQLLYNSISPDLNSGVTFSTFIPSGNRPLCKDKLLMYLNGMKTEVKIDVTACILKSSQTVKCLCLQLQAIFNYSNSDTFSRNIEFLFLLPIVL